MMPGLTLFCLFTQALLVSTTAGQWQLTISCKEETCHTW